MKLDASKIDRFESFLNKVSDDAYSEPPKEPHISISKRMVEYFLGKCLLTHKSMIHDVGCGQGFVLGLFKQKGLNSIGITLDSTDAAICRKSGFEVYEMDQTFLDFHDHQFDAIWCRHCLEHSILPYFVLSEFFRVLKPKGYVYIEVPAPDTECRHQTNHNHYSVLGKSMWIELIQRTGFLMIEDADISFNSSSGHADTYWAFIQQKP